MNILKVFKLTGQNITIDLLDFLVVQSDFTIVPGRLPNDFGSIQQEEKNVGPIVI